MSPARVFGLTWCIVFALTNLKLSRLQSEWTIAQWAAALAGPASFLLGVFLVYLMNIGSSVPSILQLRQQIKDRKINSSRLFFVVVVAFITYSAGYFVIYLVKGYVPAFARFPGAARIDYFIFGVGLLIYNLPIVVFFAIVFHVLTPGSANRKWILTLIAAIALLSYLLLLQRYQLIMIAVMAFTLLYYTTRFVRLRTIALFLALGFLVIYSVSTLRTGQLVQLVLYKTSFMKYSYRYAIFTEPYMYVSIAIENFVRGVSRLDQHTFGYYTFDSLLALSGLKHWLQDYYGIVETPFLMSGYNTYTAFWTFYRDFGYPGLVFLPLTGGGLVGAVYHAMRRQPTIERVSFYSIMVFVMGLSFFLNPLGFLWFLYIIIWMTIIFKIIRVEKPHRLGGLSVQPV